MIGISKAFQLIMSKLGHENILVTGYIDETAHAWNMIKIENEWVFVDITSDKFVKDDEGNTVEAVHTYFNVNKKFIEKNNKFDNTEYLPESTSTEKTYYVKNKALISAIEDFDKRVEEIFNSQKDRKIVELQSQLEIDIPERLVKKLQDMSFEKLKTDGNKITMTYYNEQNIYIIPKI